MIPTARADKELSPIAQLILTMATQSYYIGCSERVIYGEGKKYWSKNSQAFCKVNANLYNAELEKKMREGKVKGNE